ncbi:hypothetical protein [Herbiconiux daphne]|uniref:Uncharacterized protein n=1 Tax=Herbiconiux daphne TaxID=2970914 RepID=A0ABT2HA25_9MICO|nr:hypothetical protein [Herbiconiux daphne]MCS5736742.1 hypothetical protein [Herbiconiux daphne]
MTSSIIELAKQSGSMGFTVSEMSAAAKLSVDLVSDTVEQLRVPSNGSKLPEIIKTIDSRNDESIYIHISQMANYTYARKARMAVENPEYGKWSTPIETVVHDEVYERAMDEDTTDAE